MEQRVRIVDIAEELGVSTATVSNVIHGKTKKISDRTVRRVQEMLEERQYIPSMAGILLSQNNSRIVGVVVNDHIKYEGKVLEDAFVSASLNALLFELEKSDYFMMVKATEDWNEIVRFASMWNMDGLVLIGFCESDYKRLREKMHIPFVVYDGYFEENKKICNLIIDNYDGGRQVGEYLYRMGHRNILCVSDNNICMDKDRMDGCRAGAQADSHQAEIGMQNGEHISGQTNKQTEGQPNKQPDKQTEVQSDKQPEGQPDKQECKVDWLQIPMNRQERMLFYTEHLPFIRQYTAIFAMSDAYAVELLYFIQKNGISVPEEISVIGFDNTVLSRSCHPALTTVGQDAAQRAKAAVQALKELKEGVCEEPVRHLPVQLVLRESVRKIARI